MDDDRPEAGRDNENPPPDDGLDAAVIAADDTGMLQGERLITLAEIEEGRA